MKLKIFKICYNLDIFLNRLVENFWFLVFLCCSTLTLSWLPVLIPSPYREIYVIFWFVCMETFFLKMLVKNNKNDQIS